MIDINQEAVRRSAAERLQRMESPVGDSAMDRITRLTSQLLGVPSAGFAVIDLERRQFRSQLNLPGPESTRLVAFCASGMLSDEPLVVEDTLLDARFQNDPLVTGAPQIRFLMSAPVRNPDMLSLGALFALDLRPRRVSPTEIDAIKDLAALLEREIVLRSLMRIDPLTGLQTRYYYEFEMDREWRRARRSRSPFTALLVDVDRMAAYNDMFGQDRGDRALAEIGRLLSRRFRRASDVMVRIAGDRLLVLLPDTEAGDGLRLADAIRSEVEALQIGSTTTGVTLTVSVGCATASSEDAFNRGHELLIEDAEDALGAAKRAGGNRVAQFSSEPRTALPEPRLSF